MPTFRKRQRHGARLIHLKALRGYPCAVQPDGAGLFHEMSETLLSERRPDPVSQILATAAPYGSVLVVDDDPVSRQILQLVARAAGASQVFQASDGEQALRILDVQTPDLIVLDIMMPRLDGIETCRRLRLDPRHIHRPVLIQSALDDPATRARGFAAGASDVVSKPLDVDETKARLRVHLENQALVKSLEAFRARMDVHLALAAKLAKSLLPSAAQRRRVEAAAGISLDVVHRPKEEVGGDFWLIRELPEGQVLLMIADCVGHGVAAAMSSFRTEAVVRGIPTSDPATFLSQLDRRLAEIDEGFLTVAATAVQYDPGTHTAVVCVAGAPRAVLLDPDGAREVCSGGLPLGSGLFEPRPASVRLGADQALLFYSDGWAFGDPQISMQLVTRALAEERRPTAASLAGKVPHPGDDMTLILMRRSEP